MCNIDKVLTAIGAPFTKLVCYGKMFEVKTCLGALVELREVKMSWSRH